MQLGAVEDGLASAVHGERGRVRRIADEHEDHALAPIEERGGRRGGIGDVLDRAERLRNDAVSYPSTLASEIVAGAVGPTLPTPTALTSVAPPPSRSSATVTEASAASHDVKTPNCPRMGLGPASGTLAALVPTSTACSMATPPAGSSRSTSRLTPDTRVTESVAEGT